MAVKRKSSEMTDVGEGGTAKLQRVQTQLVTKVNRLIKSRELKHFDATFPVTQIDFDTNHVHNCGLVLQGDTLITRDGSRLYATSLEFKGMIRQETTPSSFGTQLRIMVVKSKQRFIPASNVSTTTTGVLENAGTLSAPNSPYEANNRVHWVKLYDKPFYVNGDTAGPTGENLWFNIKLGHQIVFDEASTTAEAGQVRVLLFSNRSAASGDGPEVSFTTRLWFRDS